MGSRRRFPTTLLPEPLRSFVDQAAAAIGCDRSYLAMPVLAAAGAAIGNTRRIRLKRDWQEPPVIWAAVVGDSGTQKTPAFEMALRPLFRRQARLMTEHRECVSAYEAEREAWKNAPKAARGEPPTPPTNCEHVYCTDVTVEALAERLDASPRGVLVAIDELAGWFGGLDRYKTGGGGSDVAHYLSMHRAGTLKVDRKTGDRRTMLIPRASVGIVGGIQPATLQRVLRPEFFENGLAARFLLAMPARKPKRWTEAEVDRELLGAVERLFEGLFALAPDQLPGGPEPVSVDLDEAAKLEFVRFYDEHATEQSTLSANLAAAWSKLEGYAARLALIFHQVKVASGAVDQYAHVDEETLAEGIALARWFAEETRRVYGYMAETDEQRMLRESLELVGATGGTMSPRELHRTRAGDFPSVADATVYLQHLVDQGYGTWMQANAGSRGRPSMVFAMALNPDIDVIPRQAG
ncbi:MAG: YfjI family protein [Phycisphaerae bacterium]|nr:YfjI family protein [Tepidisphaeraceae bacterium]